MMLSMRTGVIFSTFKIVVKDITQNKFNKNLPTYDDNYLVSISYMLGLDVDTIIFYLSPRYMYTCKL